MKNKNIIYIVLSFFIVLILFLLPVMWLSSDPPIADVTIRDSEEYMEVNSYVRKQLRKNYINPFPNKIPLECRSEYYYNYNCNYDGDLYFTLFLELRSTKPEYYLSEKSRILKLFDDEVTSQGESDYITFCIPDLDEFLSKEYCQKEFSIDMVVFNNREKFIRYILSYQCDNTKIPAQILSELSVLRSVAQSPAL